MISLPTRVAFCAALFMIPLPAQVGPTLFPTPGSQTNSPTASLTLFGDLPVLGLPTPFPIMGVGTASTTLAWTTSLNFPAVSFTLTGALDGTPSMPVALVLDVDPLTVLGCGGFGSAPCATGPYLFGSLPTPFGTYHLGTTPVALFDGIGTGLNPAPPATLDATGTFPLAGTFFIGGSNPSPAPQKSFQALVADPAAPSGYTLTAAFTIAEWIQYP